jgi:hypothetical protein
MKQPVRCLQTSEILPVHSEQDPYQTASTEMTEAEIARIEAEVTQALNDWIEAYGGMDCDGTSRFYHPVYLAATSGGQIVGYSGVLDRRRSIF